MIEEPKSKCYLITHGMLSAAVAGVQGAHAMHELDMLCSSNAFFLEWDYNSLTIVLVNGGNTESLDNIQNLLCGGAAGADLPFVAFHEDRETLDGILTAIAVVLPAELANWDPNPMWERPGIKDVDSINFYPAFKGNMALYCLVRAIRRLPLVR